MTEAKRDLMGSFALQGTKGTSLAVLSFSFGSSTVRAVLIPGTEHPVPTMNGMIDLPERPNFLKISSKKNAIRDLYPLASNKDKQTKSLTSCGTKERTVEIPPMIPFASKSEDQTEHHAI